MGGLPLDPGMMSARLDLEMRDDVSDGQGGIVPAFVPVTSVWARIEPVTLKQEERAGEEVFSVTHRLWIRFREDLAAGMRFRKGGRVFALKAFHDPDETRRYIVCACVEEGP
ncbi:phage head closure protein [Pararhizobium gei]|uniref:phage head closure protein n=1 Tax=Pararhizobium gei TaxID=1395951 RepID=UPI0023DC92A4|nr:phage head closure protein [Rhizobium gei]